MVHGKHYKTCSYNLCKGYLSLGLELYLPSTRNPSNSYLFRERTDEVCMNVGNWVVEGLRGKKM